MIKHLKLLQGVLFVVGVIFGTGALADNCSGTFHNANQTADTQDFGNGVTLTSFSELSSSTFNDKNDIRAGGCVGYALTMADGQARVVYACARKNAAGDVSVDEGSLEPGAKRGTWKVTTATGSLAKELGNSGWWEPTIQEGKVNAGIWGGNCK